MRILIQRVTEGRVEIGGEVIANIGSGLVVFLGIAGTDTGKEADYLVDKLAGLRIFPDRFGKMNLNIREAGGALLVVSQFTLYADCRRGRRPSFDRAAGRDHAMTLYEYFLAAARATGVPVAAGVFQAHMMVRLVNDGPVTIMVDSADK
jgi:D-tyrosyl-tRNA(Tyr) deacylase